MSPEWDIAEMRRVLRARGELLERFERDLSHREALDVRRNFRIFDALLAHARAIGAMPTTDPLDGIETDIALARALRG